MSATDTLARLIEYSAGLIVLVEYGKVEGAGLTQPHGVNRVVFQIIPSVGVNEDAVRAVVAHHPLCGGGKVGAVYPNAPNGPLMRAHRLFSYGRKLVAEGRGLSETVTDG